MASQQVPPYTSAKTPSPTKASRTQTDAGNQRLYSSCPAGETASTAKRGTAARIHRQPPAMFSRVYMGRNSCWRWRTIPATPYSVSKGSFSKK